MCVCGCRILSLRVSIWWAIIHSFFHFNFALKERKRVRSFLYEWITKHPIAAPHMVRIRLDNNFVYITKGSLLVGVTMKYFTYCVCAGAPPPARLYNLAIIAISLLSLYYIFYFGRALGDIQPAKHCNVVARSAERYQVNVRMCRRKGKVKMVFI